MRRTAHYCVKCDGKILVWTSWGLKVPQDDQHDLCQRCWKAEKDRSRLAVDSTGS